MKTFPAFKNSGFTLIELLISVSILVIITAITIPNFSTFITSQNLKQAQEAIRNGIRDTQNRAVTGVDSSGTYSYWAIKFVDDESTYKIGKTVQADSNACLGMTATDVSSKLPGNATIAVNSSPACIFYKMVSSDWPAAGPVGLYSNRYVRVSINSSCYSVDVNSAGLVRGLTTCP